ncbi:MAG: NADP-dependent oxidoreductase [Gammaproteobacteria bacterium]|nr:NADP-dependent oxidoreductase [Gammaproteobacteria bacterium]
MPSRAVSLKNRPVGMPTPDDFQVMDVDVPDPGDGEVLVENVCMSVDPYMRGRMWDRKSYVPPFQIGETLTGGAVGRVVKSNDPALPEGEHVESHFGWREAFVAPGAQVRRIGDLEAPASAYLGVLGMPGMTAYVGLLDVGALQDGETVFVSGAAGAVGSAVGQIARIKGCTVIGSAGGPEKAAHLTEDLGFDHAIDYREGNVLARLREAAPEGIDVYFDNVGGEHLQAAIMCMRPNGRIPLCGAISQYNATRPAPGPNNLSMAIGLGLTLRGFIVSNFNHLRADFVRDMTAWVKSGELRYRETVFEGIERAPEAFIGLFTGVNTGKMIVNLRGQTR